MLLASRIKFLGSVLEAWTAVKYEESLSGLFCSLHISKTSLCRLIVITESVLPSNKFLHEYDNTIVPIFI